MTSRRRRGGSSAGDARGGRRGLPWEQVYPTLDLHGETGDSARERADRWLRGQRSEHVRVVRVVTGKGLHSVGPPVLPGEITELLRRLEGSVVAIWHVEMGGGAFRVELTPPETGRRATAPGTQPELDAADDAELRLRAEESLAELGITPTHALLRVEMRRLKRESDSKAAKEY